MIIIVILRWSSHTKSTSFQSMNQHFLKANLQWEFFLQVWLQQFITIISDQQAFLSAAWRTSLLLLLLLHQPQMFLFPWFRSRRWAETSSALALARCDFSRQWPATVACGVKKKNWCATDSWRFGGSSATAICTSKSVCSEKACLTNRFGKAWTERISKQ